MSETPHIISETAIYGSGHRIELGAFEFSTLDWTLTQITHRDENGRGGYVWFTLRCRMCFKLTFGCRKGGTFRWFCGVCPHCWRTHFAAMFAEADSHE